MSILKVRTEAGLSSVECKREPESNLVVVEQTTEGNDKISSAKEKYWNEGQQHPSAGSRLISSGLKDYLQIPKDYIREPSERPRLDAVALSETIPLLDLNDLFGFKRQDVIVNIRRACQQDGFFQFSLEEKHFRPAIMGGEPVTTEPSVLIVDEDVRSILEEAGLLSLFKKFSRYNESITNQFIESWKDGRVVVSGMEIIVNEALIADVLDFPNEDLGIARESLPKPWDRVAVQGMKYLTLEGKFRKLFGYHIVIMNSMRNKEKINIPLFLYKSLKKSMHAIKAGGFARVSGSPISKAQLLLGPIPASPLTASGDLAIDSKGYFESLERIWPPKNPKEKGGRKRKLLAQILSVNLAKCSRRSTKLQKNTEGKSSLLDIAESSEEDRKSEDPKSLGGRSSPSKVSATTPSVKSEKSPTDSLSLCLRSFDAISRFLMV
eukprot:Gb_32169 [translate_table: standard]